jgi:hypothetical protein
MHVTCLEVRLVQEVGDSCVIGGTGGAAVSKNSTADLFAKNKMTVATVGLGL